MNAFRRIFYLICMAFLFFLSLPYAAIGATDEGLDVVFVLDRSGSMRALTAGPGSPSRMDLAARAIELFAIGMSHNDRIGISGFTWHTQFTKAPVRVTDDTFKRFNELVYDQVTAVQRGGYTDILLGLRNGVEMLKQVPSDPSRRKIFVLLTDGKMEGHSAADMEERYGPGTSRYFGEQWRPLIARDTAWLVENEIPVHVILLGSESDAFDGRIDQQFTALVASLTHGSFHWARSADDLRSIYRRLWHQLANRPIPTLEQRGNAIEVDIGDRISEMQVVLSASRRPDMSAAQAGTLMEASFFHNNVRVTRESIPDMSLSFRRGYHALAYTFQNPSPGIWRIEPRRMDADIWVDVETWWTLEPRVLGTKDHQLDISQPFRFEVAVLDKESGRPIDDPGTVAGISALGIVTSSTDARLKMHDDGKVHLGWDSARKAFTGNLFTKDGISENIEGTFNALCMVQFSETQETAPHTLVVRHIPPVGNLTVLPERITAFGSQGARGPLAGVSADGRLVNPVLHLQAARDLRAEVRVTASDFVNNESGRRLGADRIHGVRTHRISAGGTAELVFELDVPPDAPAGTYQGHLSVNSATPNIADVEVPVTLEIGGPPANVLMEAILTPGASKSLSMPIPVPDNLLQHTAVVKKPLSGPDGFEISLTSAKIEAGEVRIAVSVPSGAPGGLYEADLPIHAPGLATGRARVRLEVVRHRVSPESLHLVLLPGMRAETSIKIENTASRPLQYDLKIARPPEGFNLEALPPDPTVYHDMPAQVSIAATAAPSAPNSGQVKILISSDIGPVAEIPVELTVIDLSVERISLHDTFRVAAGKQSSPIEYRIQTTSPEPLLLDVIAEEFLSETGQTLPADAVVFESGGVSREGRIQVSVSDDRPVELSIRVKAPDYSRGTYKGAIVVTGSGFSDYRESMNLQVGAIWIEGPNPLFLPDEQDRWEGSITVYSSLKDPVRVTHRLEAEPLVSAAISVLPRAEAIIPGAPMVLDLRVDRANLPYGRHVAEVFLDTRGLAGTDSWKVFIQVGGLQAVSLRYPGPDPLHDGIRVIKGRQAAEFRLKGNIVGRIDPGEILETYRQSATLVFPDRTVHELDVAPRPITTALREPEWTIAIPPLRPGKYRLDISSQNINLESALNSSFDFYVLPPFEARMTSGGLAGFPARFETIVKPEDLEGVSDFRAWVVLTAPNQRERRIDLVDDGTGGDALAGDGIYTGTYLLPADQLGRFTWKGFHAFRIGDRRFEVDVEEEFIVDAGLWIEGARLSKRDPGVLSLPGRITRLGRNVDIRVATSSTGWTDVDADIGEIRRIGTETFSGTMPLITISSGETRARATEPFEGQIPFEVPKTVLTGTYLVPITVAIGTAQPQTAMLEFYVWRVPWWFWLAVAALIVFLYVTIIVPVVWKIKLSSFKNVSIISGGRLDTSTNAFSDCCWHGRWQSFRKLFSVRPFATFAAAGADIEVEDAIDQGRLIAAGGIIIIAETQLVLCEADGTEEALNSGDSKFLRMDGKMYIELKDQGGKTVGKVRAVLETDGNEGDDIII